MTYYFALSDGEYSDYGVSGFYMCNHSIDEKDFETFCDEQHEWEEKQFAERGFTRYWLNAADSKFDRDTDGFRAWEQGRNWLESIGSKEARFVKLHNLIAIDYTELHRG